MFGEKRRESDRFVAKLATDRGLAMHREVSLVEQEIEDLVHARDARPQLVERWRDEVGRGVAKPLARTLQALVHVRFSREQAERDLGGAETAQRLECEDDTRFARNRVVATHEQHAQE